MFSAHKPALDLVKVVRDPDEDAGAVSAVVVRGARAAVLHPGGERLRVLEDGVRRPAVDVDDEAHAARVPLVEGVVETLLQRVGRAGGVERHLDGRGRLRSIGVDLEDRESGGLDFSLLWDSYSVKSEMKISVLN